MAITIDDVEAARRKLAELPRNRPREVTKQEAVTLLVSELGGAKRRGYSPEDLAGVLSETGIAINAETLRGYLRRARRSHKRGGQKRATERAGGVESLAEQARTTAAVALPVVAPATGARSVPTAVVAQNESMPDERPSATPAVARGPNSAKGASATGR